MRRAGGSATVLSLALLLSPSLTGAQTVEEDADYSDGMALNRHEPTAPGEPFFGVATPMIQGGLVPRFSLTLDYARRPLVLHVGDRGYALVEAQVFAHIGASLGIVDRLLLDVSMPLALVQVEGDPRDRAALAGFSFTLSEAKPEERPVVDPTPGDLRFGARIRLWGDDWSPLQAGLGLRAHFPTGRGGKLDQGALVGEGAMRITPQLLVGGRTTRLVWSGALELLARRSTPTTPRPTSLLLGAGAALVLGEDRLQIGPELSLATPLYEAYSFARQGISIAQRAEASAELLLGARLRLGAMVLGGAASAGLGRALGTPEHRVLLSLAYSPRLPPKEPPPVVPRRESDDIDEDGIVDARDACPHAFGGANRDQRRHGCPLQDLDEDGIDDAEDRCPEDGGFRDGSPGPGCPRDSDGDGRIDAMDLCPDQPGKEEHLGCGRSAREPKSAAAPASALDAEEPAKTDGAPSPAVAAPTAPNPLYTQDVPALDDEEAARIAAGDHDGDGFLNAEDACIYERGVAASPPEARGCPARVRVRYPQIVLLEPIAFRAGRYGVVGVHASSEALLTDVRDVIAQHPEYELIELQGYTDNTGTDGYNRWISRRRAEMVRAWLVAHGVPPEKLVAKGYGPVKPIASNLTRAERLKNRRIEIVVLEVAE